MLLQIIDDLAQHLTQLPNTTFPAQWTPDIELCPQGMQGDITINAFKFSRFLGKKPDEVATDITEFLKQHPDCEAVESVKGFINITLKPVALFRDTLQNFSNVMNATILPESQKQKILIEFSAPNTNKPQHLGHVRNNTLGMSLASLLNRVGHHVIPVNLVNDRGVHICKSMLAYERWGNGVTPESAKKKGDHLVGDFYVLYNQKLEEQIRALREEKNEFADKSSDELFLQTEIGAATQKMLQDWENGNQNVRDLWKLMNSWVLAGFAETYQRMGINFTKTYYESNTYQLGKDIVNQGLDRNVFQKREDGALFAPLGKKLGDKIVLRSDGTSVYITQDIGTTLLKHDEWNADRQIWVVGDEQLLHFKQLFEIMRLLGYAWAEGLYHLSYGMVNLPSGKMKSREGTVVDADDLFDEMHKLAKERILESAGENVPEDLETRAEMIGMGALKFMLLKFNAKTTIMFDPQASVRFEGDTGPYVQYASTRIKAILRKAADRQLVPSDLALELMTSPEEKALATKLLFWPATLQSAAEKMDCAPLTLYLLDLAKLFSRFYAACPVLAAENKDIAQSRLFLCERVQKVLEDGLKTLTIQIPEAM